MKKIKIILGILILSMTNNLNAQDFEFRTAAEWEPVVGTLIRWPLRIPPSLCVELAKEDTLYVVHANESEKNSAVSKFKSAGVNMENVVFIQTAKYSEWSRDWGPYSVFDDDGTWVIVDPEFRGYPWVAGCGGTREIKNYYSAGYRDDDAINGAVADLMNCETRKIPVHLVGGNFETDGHGIAFSTEQMVCENLEHDISEEVFHKTVKEALGINKYHIVDNPEVYGIQHIDCYIKLLDEETILVKETDASNEEYNCIEAMVDYLKSIKNCYGRPFKVERIYCGTITGDQVAAYTNSYILNKKVLVPLFNISTDEQAIETYKRLMPGYEIIGIKYSDWYYYDALHCRTRGIFDKHMLYMRHKRIGAKVNPGNDYTIDVAIYPYSKKPLIEDKLLINWRTKGRQNWDTIQLSSKGGVNYQATIPEQPEGSIIEYFISAGDESGREENLPRAGYYSFTVETTTDIISSKKKVIPE